MKLCNIFFWKMTVSRKYSLIIACLLAVGVQFGNAEAATSGFKVSGLPVYAPDRPMLWSVCTETPKQLSYEIFRIPPEDRMNFLGGMMPFDRYMVDKTALTAGTWLLDGLAQDGREPWVETSLPPLPTGTYLLAVDRKVFTPFQVSDIAFFDWGTVGVTASRTTGNALSDATIDRFTAEYDYTVHLNRYERLGSTRHADTNGFTDLNGPAGSFFLIRYGDDSLIRTFVPPVPLAANRPGIMENDTVAGVHLFLDLPVYKPGDSVRFKGVLWGRKGERGTPFPIAGKTLLFTPEPPTDEDDGAVVLHADTDNSGGFTGGFRLPDRADTGLWQWRIQPVRPSRTDRRLAEAADTTGQEPGRFMFTNTTVPFRVGRYRTFPSELEIRVENRDTVLTVPSPDCYESIDGTVRVFYSIENRDGKTQQGVIRLDADTAPTATPEQHLDLSEFAHEDDLNILLAYVRNERLFQHNICRPGRTPDPALEITIERLSDTAYIRSTDTLTLHVYRHGRGVAVPLTLALYYDEYPAPSTENRLSKTGLVTPAPPVPFSRQFRYDPVWDSVTDCNRTIPADGRSAATATDSRPDGTRLESRPSRCDGQSASVYFFPTLWSDADGYLSLPFNLPARPGRYRWAIATYDRDLQAAYATKTLQARQDYRYSRRLPRIFYVGNLFWISAKANRPNPTQTPGFVWETAHIPFSIQPGEQIVLTLPKPLRKALRKSQETDTSFYWMPDATQRLTRLCEEINLDTTADAWNALLHYLKTQLSHGKSARTTTAYNRLHRFLTDEGGFCRLKGQPADSTVSLAIAEALAANVANGLNIRLLLRHSLLPYLEQTAYGSLDADSTAGLPTTTRLRYLYTAASTYGPTAHIYTAALNRDLHAFAENIDRYPINSGIYGLYALYLHGDTTLFEQCRQHYRADLHAPKMELQTAALVYRLLVRLNERTDAATLSRWIGRQNRTRAIDALNLAYNERLYPLAAWPDTTTATWELHGRRLTIDWRPDDTAVTDTVNACVYGTLTFNYTKKTTLTSSETPRNRLRPARTNRRRICGSKVL